MKIIPLTLATDHPAYRGHFPGRPVLPGVVLLDAAIHALETNGLRLEVSTAKFQSAVLPGDQLALLHEQQPNGSIRFSIQAADRPVANGVLVPTQSPAGHDRGEQG